MFFISFVQKKYQVYQENFRKFGTKTYGRYDGIVPCVVTMDPDVMKSVLVKNFENFSDIFSEVSSQKHLYLLTYTLTFGIIKT